MFKKLIPIVLAIMLTGANYTYAQYQSTPGYQSPYAYPPSNYPYLYPYYNPYYNYYAYPYAYPPPSYNYPNTYNNPTLVLPPLYFNFGSGGYRGGYGYHR
jgi:hypothetical protein